MVEILPNLHPVFVHFTVALFWVSASFFILSQIGVPRKHRLHWRIVANWTMWSGAVITLFTVASGVYAFNTVNHDSISHAAMIQHRNWAIVTLVLILIMASWSFFLYKERDNQNRVFIFSVSVVALVLATTAWHGGELVYRHGLGVLSLPDIQQHEHGQAQDHSHADPNVEPKPTKHDALDMQNSEFGANALINPKNDTNESHQNVEKKPSHTHNRDHDHAH